MNQEQKILLVDDRAENLLALEGLLRDTGATLLKAGSGPVALELLLDHEVALAIVDIQMPGMDGFEFAELMRGLERTREIPIIFVTAGLHDQARIFKGYEAGAVDFLIKPLEPRILAGKVAVFLQLYRQRQQLAERVGELEVALAQREKAEAALRASEARLLEADRRKDDFLAVLSHELRNPLAPIKNSLFILSRTPPGGDQARRAHEVIDRQVGQLASLVDDLLDVTRVSRNKIHLKRERLEFNGLVRGTLEDNASLFDHSGVQVELALPAEPLFIDADATRVAQAIGNLLQNAAKFTARGGRVRVSVAAEGLDAVLAVADTGAGMDATTLAGLFQPFMQADKTLDRSKGGLGLGLALVKGLVELHGGRISAGSEGLGKGSRFEVRLPLDSRAAPEAPLPMAKADRARRRILIIEDNIDAAESLRDALQMSEHEVEVAHNGPDGLERARRTLPEVVLCDIGLPGMDGYEVARAFCRDAVLRQAFLVAVSGYARPEDLERASAAGFARHLPKPPSLEKLEEILASSPPVPAPAA